MRYFVQMNRLNLSEICHMVKLNRVNKSFYLHLLCDYFLCDFN